MIRRPPRPTRPYTLFPSTPLVRSAEQLLAEKRGSKGVILGPSGVGKTTLLKTADATRTLFIDLEAGDLAVLDWPGDSVRPRTWQECRDLACYIGGPNPALRDDQRSEEHTSELQSLMRISYAVFCLKKKTPNT